MNKAEKILAEEAHLFRRLNDGISRMKGKDEFNAVVRLLKTNEIKRQLYGGVLMRRAKRRAAKYAHPDKERLDFISKNPRHVVFRRGLHRGPLQWIAREREYARWSLHTNLRKAIDAAIRAARRRP